MKTFFKISLIWSVFCLSVDAVSQTPTYYRYRLESMSLSKKGLSTTTEKYNFASGPSINTSRSIVMDGALTGDNLLQVTGRVPDLNGNLSPFPVQSSELRLTAVESSFGSHDNGSISPKWLTSSINGLQTGKWEQSVRGGNFQTVSTTVNTPNYTKTSSDAYNQGTFDQFRAFFQDQWTFVFKSVADVGGGTSTLHTQTVWQNQSFTYNAPSTQTINGRLYNFVSYTDGVGPGRFVSPSYNLPTRYDALYKAPLMSNLSDATQGGSTRSYVTSQSGSIRRELQVYESDGRVYLLYSSNGGST